MGWFSKLFGRKANEPDVEAQQAIDALLNEPLSESDGFFVYIKIPEQIEPIDRGEKYEDPLQEMLDAEGLGEVTGGGTMLSGPAEDGSKEILFCGIDVDLLDFERGIPFLREAMRRLEAPKQTVLEFELDGEPQVVPIYDES